METNNPTFLVTDTLKNSQKQQLEGAFDKVHERRSSEMMVVSERENALEGQNLKRGSAVSEA